MERKRGLRDCLLKVITGTVMLLHLSGCTESTWVDTPSTKVRIIFETGTFNSRSLPPDEEKISDLCLMIFDERGVLENYQYLTGGKKSCDAILLKGARYSIYACANTGYPVKADRINELEDITYHLAYPDEYKEGIPMYAEYENIIIDESPTIHLEMSRLMARISVCIDRSRLSDDVKITVTDIRIGNCPKSVKVFRSSSVTDEDGCFSTGFQFDDTACTPLNETGMNGRSREISLYMLENMQGQFSDNGLSYDHEKVFGENDHRRKTCSYIEMRMEYSSDTYMSMSQPLVYRFYLGEDRNSLDVERNCHYHITVYPEDDGLGEDSWCVDKSGLEYVGKTYLEQYPGNHIVGDIGDTIHIGCRLLPSDAPFDIGLEYLEADRNTGIYDYSIDSDGHGVTLTLKNPGTGLIYMEAGSPINDAALFLIEVNRPRQ